MANLEYIPTSVSASEDLASALSELATLTGEPDAVLYRQIVRVAIARGWSGDRLRAVRPLQGGDRRVLRVAMKPSMKEAADALCGPEMSFSRWFMCSASRFIELAEWGDSSIWSLHPR